MAQASGAFMGNGLAAFAILRRKDQRMGSSRWSLWAVGGVLAISVGVTLFAQKDADVEVASLLPAQTVLYLHVGGLTSEDEAFQQTAAYQALYESGLMDVIQTALTSIGEASAEASELMTAVQAVQERGFVLSLAVNGPQPGPPGAWGIIVVPEGGDGVEMLSDLIRKIPDMDREIKTQKVQGRSVERIQLPDAPVEIGWWNEKGHLAIAFGMNAIASAIAVADGQQPNITENEVWAKYEAEEADFDQRNVAWFHFGALREMFGEMPLPLPAEEQPTVNTILADLGLDTLKHIAVRSGFDEAALWSELIIEAPGERTGLMSLLDQPEFTLADLPAIPSRHSGVTVRSFDLSAAYDTLLEVTRKLLAYAPEEKSAEFEQMLADAEEELGFDPAELLGSLGHLSCAYGDNWQGSFGSGLVILHSVRDQKKLEEILGQLMDRLEAESDGEVELLTTERSERSLTMVNIPKFPILMPTYCVDENWLIVGLTPQAVEAQLLRMDGDLEWWDPASDETVSAALEEMGDSFTGLNIVNPQETYRMLLSFAPAIVGFIRLGIQESGEFPEDFSLPIYGSDIPPVEVVVRPLFANVAVSTVDEDGCYVNSRDSLPGLPLLGGGGGSAGLATSATLTALLLPAVQNARNAARALQSKNNMKMLGLALHNYHDTYNQFPTGTIANPNLPPEERLSWLVSILPYIEEAQLWTEINMKEGWESTANEPAMTSSIEAFLHPGGPKDEVRLYGVTHYVGVAGVGKDGPTLPVNSPKAGIFAFDRPTRIRDITDGTSNTMMVIEASADAGPWGAGGRSTIRPLTQAPYVNGPDGFGSPKGQTVDVLFADGAVRTISADVDPSVFEKLATMAGGEVVSGDDF